MADNGRKEDRQHKSCCDTPAALGGCSSSDDGGAPCARQPPPSCCSPQPPESNAASAEAGCKCSATGESGCCCAPTYYRLPPDSVGHPDTDDRVVKLCQCRCTDCRCNDPKLVQSLPSDLTGPWKATLRLPVAVVALGNGDGGKTSPSTPPSSRLVAQQLLSQNRGVKGVRYDPRASVVELKTDGAASGAAGGGSSGGGGAAAGSSSALQAAVTAALRTLGLIVQPLLDGIELIRDDNDTRIDMSPALKTTRLSVEGMTCAACVAALESALQRLPGVLSVNVSLMTAQAVVQHDPAVVGGDALAAAIDDAGFEAHVLSDEAAGGAADAAAGITRLAVTGMTCTTCVTAVECGLRALPGVMDATVNLMTGRPGAREALTI